MIDALELSVPGDFRFRRDQLGLKGIRIAGKRSPYWNQADCRPTLSVVIQYGHKFPVTRSQRGYQLQFKGARHLTSADLIRQVEGAFEISESDVLQLPVTRIDFAADVFDVPVQWFREHCRVRFKRSSAQWRETTTMGVTGIVIGRRPDYYRIYDKVRELRSRKQEVLYTGKWNGLPEPILTRVERQCSGRAVPKNMSRLGGLLSHAEGADPFCSLTLSPGAGVQDEGGWGAQKWLMNLGLQAAVQQYGEIEVRSRLNRMSRNANRVFAKYSDLLRAAPAGITNDQLRRLYAISTSRQLNRPREGQYPMGGFQCLL